MNNYAKKILAEPEIEIRAFFLTPVHLSIAFSKEVEEITPAATVGIDRNLSNLAVGNYKSITHYDLSKTIQIAESNRSVMRSLRRNDARIRKQLAMRHGRRRKDRINQLLHRLSKTIVRRAKVQKTAIVLEDIRGIRGLYVRGNGQGKNHRAIMNSWPYYELERQVKYKAAWEGIPIIQLTKAETRGTSQVCPRCGKRTQVAARADVRHQRQLWCECCMRWLDRDVVAAMNVAYKGLLRFSSPQGPAGEAMVQESRSKEPVILKIDAAKLSGKAWQNL